MKNCIKCGVEKPLSEYYIGKKMKDGHLNTCKECFKAQVLSRYTRRPPRPRQEEVTYIGMHKRVVREKGPACTHKCVDCDKQAKDWSYNNNGSKKRYAENNGKTIEYSLDANDYDPRCRACHLKFDQPLRVAA